MANKWASNYPIPAANSVWEGIWKLTRVKKAAGWLYMAGSDGTTKNTSGVAANDLWGGNADPLLDAPMPIVNARWIVLKGPSTLKLPLDAAPTGNFLRGETVTQAVTTAEGELVGYVWDGVGLTGYMVILPRTGAFDMNPAHTITGSSSGATAIPLTGGTLITYAREVMYYKPGASDVTLGAIYYICADAVADAAQFFSALAAAAAGCTATVGPGMGGVGNAFPAKAICVRGNAGSTVVANSNWFGTLVANFQTNFEIAATNVTPAAGVSADGTFWITATNSGAANSCGGFGFFRLDDTEPGDCDPFVWFRPCTQSTATWNNTVSTGCSIAYDFSWSNLMPANRTPAAFFGYQAKGHATLDVPNLYTAMIMASAGGASGAPGLHGMEVTVDLARPVRVLNSPAATRPLVGEPIGVISNGPAGPAAAPQYKGRLRWMSSFSVGNTYDTFANKNMLGVSVATTGAPCIAVGPYDGATTPVQ